MNKLNIIIILLLKKLLQQLSRLLNIGSCKAVQSGYDIDAAVTIFIELNHFCIFNRLIQLINKEITKFLAKAKRFFRVHV